MTEEKKSEASRTGERGQRPPGTTSVPTSYCLQAPLSLLQASSFQVPCCLPLSLLSNTLHPRHLHSLLPYILSEICHGNLFTTQQLAVLFHRHMRTLRLSLTSFLTLLTCAPCYQQKWLCLLCCIYPAMSKSRMRPGIGHTSELKYWKEEEEVL